MKTIYDSESEFVIGGYMDYVTFIYCVVLYIAEILTSIKSERTKWVERDRNIKLLLK
jgi:hypothetical protein